MRKNRVDKNRIRQLLDTIRKIEKMTDHYSDNSEMDSLLLFNPNHFRVMSRDEKAILSEEAFQYFYSLTKIDQISYENFEKIMHLFNLYLPEFEHQIDLQTLTILLEVISFADFQEKAITQAIELLLQSPELIHSLKFTVH